MSFLSDFRRAALLIVIAAASLNATPLLAGEKPLLRVCSDPNNLPFSNDRGQGFENRLARLVADDLGMKVSYYWWPQRRGFIRKTLNASKCDVIMGLPSNLDMAAMTRPYYRSSYVFVTRRDAHLDVRSLDDPRLRTLRIGVQIIGSDYANSPPAHALANRGIVKNVAGYMVANGYAKDNATRRILDAVVRRDVDISAVWGPTAGYFMRKSSVALTAIPVSPQIDVPFLPFVFDISMAVRRGDPLKEKLDGVIERRRDRIDAILRDYGVPRVDRTTEGPQS